MNYKIRKLAPDEVGVLDDFLYEAIFVREGEAPGTNNTTKRSSGLIEV